MTRATKAEYICAICGKSSEHWYLLSTNTSGLADLDTRPPEMERSTIKYWVQRCPHCGYCASDISKLLPQAVETTKSNVYQKLLNTTYPSKLANSFLCWSAIEEKSGNYVNAGWAALYAVWVCDDMGSDKEAQKCRKITIGLFQKAKEMGGNFGSDKETEEIIMIDLLRRSGQFELALKMCEEALKPRIKEKILQFQKSLIKISDVNSHTITEAIENKN
ncbi:DUF2225 domain-containing protein [Patescibacteria group bacterium]|nr:DUF2225 domain-containing protein [Patescibacteria group bacterium]MBU4274277.1 DUF2225 domain-containing protein [Patescibacteria group bacterium]MBU4367620.1 DUF2225 domain-containing protein [Patescibacteria group bacterium]MBU4462100.1 DUF2225 domain-containing protein [Patescibacteria group bacterium]MCG2700419.1 DUF2225 domain-containing protein [Candidatus Parcubacteria bacterium]